MFIDFLLDVFRENEDGDAIIWRDLPYSYGWLRNEIEFWNERFDNSAMPSGTVVAIEADFSPRAVALMLSLIERACILVPLTESVVERKESFYEIARVKKIVGIDGDDRVVIEDRSFEGGHSLLEDLARQGHPGLVLFSSGSTGQPKAALHDLVPLLDKFRIRRHGMRMIAFLLFDHIGGINTLFYILSNGGCVVTLQDRSPDGVLSAIERHRVQALPTSPSFLNLILLSEAYRRHDLSSLELVTYGTEAMPEYTLRSFNEAFPHVKLQQTYGLSEVGILRSRSKSSDSLWMKIGGEGFEIRVVGGMLEIRAESAMRGYLNAPCPFTEDGWFRTGDAVEMDGEYLRILGRKSDVINVGGEKVYPVEVESALLEMEGVEDAVVSGDRSPILGQIVVAHVKLIRKELLSDFKVRMRSFCRDRLDPYKIPQKVILSGEGLMGGRFKRKRISGSSDRE